MAAEAEALAQHLCLTSDNPRSEDPVHILAQMLAGLKAPAQTQVEPDRARAIATVVAQAQVADVVLIAGKGHETTQEIAGVKHPFSDVEHARRALVARLAREGALA
jgi:UDP-N-acetylmuramoyl-L-alanyl-D-glutamate--2,6-diaminopimelate ligase